MLRAALHAGAASLFCFYPDFGHIQGVMSRTMPAVG